MLRSHLSNTILTQKNLDRVKNNANDYSFAFNYLKAILYIENGPYIKKILEDDELNLKKIMEKIHEAFPELENKLGLRYRKNTEKCQTKKCKEIDYSEENFVDYGENLKELFSICLKKSKREIQSLWTYFNLKYKKCQVCGKQLDIIKSYDNVPELFLIQIQDIEQIIKSEVRT